MAMTTSTTQSIREGFRTVTPYVIVNKAPEMLDFMKQAFGAVETHRSTGSAGGFHIEARLGDSMLMIGGGGTFVSPAMPTSLHYFVGEVDPVYERALAAGATSLAEPVDQPYGVREAAVKDVAGNHWYISTPMKDAQGEEIFGLGTVAVYLHPKGADRLIDFMKQAFNAEEVEVYRAQEGGPVAHAKLRIIDSVIELSEAHGEWQPMPTAFFLYVADSDALFNQSLAAGATVVYPLADQPYGHGGGVQDPHGNHWYIYTHKD
jgi:PhnB protein